MDENDGRILGGYIRYMLDVQQVPYEMVRWTKDETWIRVKSEDFTARYEMAPLDELVDAYEAQWNGAAKTLVSPEWSCVIEDRDEEDMYIKVIRKEDLRMLWGEVPNDVIQRRYSRARRRRGHPQGCRLLPLDA